MAAKTSAPRAKSAEGADSTRLAGRVARLTKKRDEAYATLVELESERAHLAAEAHDGDANALKALARVRVRIDKQAALAADLDAAVDMADQRRIEAIRRERAQALAADVQRVRHLGAERVAIAQGMERHMEAMVDAWRDMLELERKLQQCGLGRGAAGAELMRFRDRFDFYRQTMLDFLGGAPVHHAHPNYRQLARVMMGGDELAAMFARDRHPDA